MSSSLAQQGLTINLESSGLVYMPLMTPEVRPGAVGLGLEAPGLGSGRECTGEWTCAFSSPAPTLSTHQASVPISYWYVP